jgi:hypothetical protein
VRFDLADRFYKSEEPIEYDETIQGVRGTREPYWRNTVDAGLEIAFGPQNTFTLAYDQSYLKNEDPTVDDGRLQTPSAGLVYWFNTKNGVELNYGYTKADYWRDDDAGVIRDDYDGDVSGIRYIHQYHPETSIFVSYDFTTRDFDGPTEDYDVHEGTIGLDHSFSPQTSLSLSGGYFKQDKEQSENEEDGPVFDALLTKRFEHGSFTIGGTGGWYQPELDTEKTGFTKYNSGTARFEYQLVEPLSFFIGGSYRVDKEEDTSREWSTLRGDTGIVWTFLQHFSLELNYRYADRDDDWDTEDYTSNRIMLTLSASKLYRK